MCICIYTHIYVDVYIFISIYKYSYIHPYIHTYIHIYTFLACVYINTYIYVHTYVVYSYVCIYIYAQVLPAYIHFFSNMYIYVLPVLRKSKGDIRVCACVLSLRVLSALHKYMYRSVAYLQGGEEDKAAYASLPTCNHTREYRVATTHRMPYLCRSFPAKQSYN